MFHDLFIASGGQFLCKCYLPRILGVGAFVVAVQEGVHEDPELLQGVGISRDVRHIVYFVRIFLQVVQLLRRLVVCHEPVLLRGELTFTVHDLHQCEDRIGLFFIGVELCVGQFGVEITDVLEVFRPYGTDAVDGLIAAVAHGEDPCAGRHGRIREVEALHPGRDGYAGQVEGGRGQIDIAHQAVLHGAFLLPCRKTDDQRCVGTGVVEELLGPHHGASLVAKEKDDGVVPQSFLVEAL